VSPQWIRGGGAESAAAVQELAQDSRFVGGTLGMVGKAEPPEKLRLIRNLATAKIVDRQ
jgi:hypothetical protein